MAIILAGITERAVDQVTRARDMLPPEAGAGHEALAKAMEFLGRALTGDDQEQAECAVAAESWAHAALKRAGYPDDMACGYSLVPGAGEEYA